MHGLESVDLKKVMAGRENEDTFYWFLDEIAPVVVGTSVFEQVKCEKLPSACLTHSLEAFTLLCLENSFDMVKSEVKEERVKAKQKYTANGRGSKKNQGWSQLGICRYNELLQQVRRDRVTYQRVDEQYLRRKQKERMDYEHEKLRRREEANGSKESGLVAAEDDFSSDSESDSE